MPRGRQFVRNGFLMLIASFVLFALIEGMASMALFAGSVIRTSRSMMAEIKHSVYDPEIGWVNAPNLDYPNLYASEIGITSNSRGFRGRRETARQTPPGKLRIVCSGDSFTLGYGVRDEEAWCEQLAAMDPRIEAVNLGMGGYGIDQMYLWYRRNAPSIDHRLHILAITGTDFERTRSAVFVGYGKPLLELRNGALSVSNQPVPRSSRWTPYWLQAGNAASRFRAIELLHSLGLGRASGERLSVPRTKEIVAAALDDIRRIGERQSAGLLLLYIPIEVECHGSLHDFEWREFWKQEASRHRAQFLDLTADCAALGREAVSKLYIHDRSRYNVNAAVGHQNAAGHRFVAERLLPLVKVALAAAR
ncbi:MAG: SGNH/GDSL hydrolase family protein [Bryobacteraceae bacterium]